MNDISIWQDTIRQMPIAFVVVMALGLFSKYLAAKVDRLTNTLEHLLTAMGTFSSQQVNCRAITERLERVVEKIGKGAV